VRVLNRGGDSIPGAPVILVSLTPDTLGIDTPQVAVVGKLAGPGRAYASSGDFKSDPFRVIVK